MALELGVPRSEIETLTHEDDDAWSERTRALTTAADELLATKNLSPLTFERLGFTQATTTDTFAAAMPDVTFGAVSLVGASGGRRSGTGSPDSRMTRKTTVDTSHSAMSARKIR